MSAGYIWLVAGLVACAAEMLHPGIFLLWIGLAAAATGILTLAMDIPVNGQLGIFIATSMVLLLVALQRVRTARDRLNEPEAGLIGQKCVASDFAGGEGRVRFRDSSWQARTTDGSSPAADTPLQIVGLKGTVLLVHESAPGSMRHRTASG